MPVAFIHICRGRGTIRRVSHAVEELWLGEAITTLGDLTPEGMWAICVGVNPSPKSVGAGHYYRGRLGKRHWKRLIHASLLPEGAGWEDDRMVHAGIGFTDVVKKPTASEAELVAADWEHGSDQLKSKLRRWEPELVIFTFRRAASAVLPNSTPGLHIAVPIDGVRQAFVMPGPFASNEEVAEHLETLAAAAAVLHP